jgi:Zn-dependent peptidase ImmA (M78 family)
VTKPDDSSLDPEDLRVVEARARNLLDRADAWGRFPVPIDDILDAANVEVAHHSAFDPAVILGYLKGKAEKTGAIVKSAISKVFGLYDGGENLIHIDETVGNSKQTFLKLHETAHHDMPTHRKMFRFFQDCEKTLAPDIADQFEREANNFARFALFKGDTFAEYAADCAFEIKTPMKLAKKFGASVYASAREFARTNHRACVVYVLEPLEYVEGDGARAAVRRVEASPKFAAEFGVPKDKVITPDHELWPVVPIGRKMSRPTSFSIADRNGQAHECVAEAFDTTYNILILLYPTKALTAQTIIMPGAAI